MTLMFLFYFTKLFLFSVSDRAVEEWQTMMESVQGRDLWGGWLKPWCHGAAPPRSPSTPNLMISDGHKGDPAVIHATVRSIFLHHLVAKVESCRNVIVVLVCLFFKWVRVMAPFLWLFLSLFFPLWACCWFTWQIPALSPNKKPNMYLHYNHKLYHKKYLIMRKT